MRLRDVILRDTRANQPAATTVAVGTLYCVTDEANVVERSNGTTWDTYAAGAGGGDVSGPGVAVTNEAIAVWNGTTGTDIKDGGATIAGVVSASVAAGGSVFAPLPTEYNAGTSGASKTIAWTNGPHQRLTVTADCTLTFTGGTAGASYRLILVQDGTGGWAITWPADVAFEDGSDPALVDTAGNVTLVSLVYTGAGSGGYLGFATTRALTL